MDKLKNRPKKEINDLFRISIDKLDYFEKEVFLDIACFYKEVDKDFVLRILDSCDLYATCGMSVLLDRCLITFVFNEVQMHDLMQQTGRAIVCEEYPKDPSKWSRLWDPNDIDNALSEKKEISKYDLITYRYL